MFSFGLVLLELLIGDCTYVKRKYRGMGCYIGKEEGGMGFRPPVPDEVLAAEPEVVAIYTDCVKASYNERPSFVEIAKRMMEQCAPTVVAAPSSSSCEPPENAMTAN